MLDLVINGKRAIITIKMLADVNRSHTEDAAETATGSIPNLNVNRSALLMKSPQAMRIKVKRHAELSWLDGIFFVLFVHKSIFFCILVSACSRLCIARFSG